MRSIVVFLSGPMDSGPLTPVQNFRAACLIAADLRRIGAQQGVRIVVDMPHAMLAVDAVTPRPREEWLADDLVKVERADCVFRFGGASHGADAETGYADALGKPAIRGIGSFQDWCASQRWPAPECSCGGDRGGARADVVCPKHDG